MSRANSDVAKDKYFQFRMLFSCIYPSDTDQELLYLAQFVGERGQSSIIKTALGKPLPDIEYGTAHLYIQREKYKSNDTGQIYESLTKLPI